LENKKGNEEQNVQAPTDILSIYRANRKNHAKKLHNFSSRLDDIENKIEEIMFNSSSSVILEDDEIEESSYKSDKELIDVLKDTQKVMKVMGKLSGKKRVYNQTPPS